MDQLVGKNFLAGYASLKGGGGNISNIEGSKTEQARGRVATAQTKEGFDSGLNDLETNMRTDLEVAQRKMNRPVTAWQHTPNDPYAPDVGQVGERKGKAGEYEYLGGNPALDSSYRRVR